MSELDDGSSWITRALADGGAVRVILVEGEAVAEAIRTAHDLPPTAARLAAEATVATLLLSAYAKGDEKLTLQIAARSPQFRWIGELDPSRRFRGRLWSDALDEAADPRAVDGVMQVAKYVRDREVYRGITGVEGTSVTRALRDHLMDSAQVAGVLAARVVLDDDGRITRAAGVLAERLPPEADKPTLTAAEFETRWGSLAEQDVEDVIRGVNNQTLLGRPTHRLETLPAIWGCTCSRTRVLDALAGLGTDELHAMADEDEGAVIDCDFCGARYAVSAEDLRTLAG